MADEQTAPTGGSEPASNDASNEALESKLASFDFGDAEPPKKKSADDDAAQPKEAGDDEAMATLAGEAKAEQPAQPEDDDPEETLRDGRKVKRSELKRGYRPDWEQRIQAHMQREQAFAQATHGFNQAQQQTAGLLQQAVEVVASRMPQAPDPNLVDTDPFEYQRRKLIYDTEKAKLDDIVVRRDAFMRQTQQQQYQATQRQLLHEREATLRSLPDLRDPVKAAKFVEGVKTLGAELGYTPVELAQVRDHRLMKLINLALEGKQMKAAYEKARAKLKENAAKAVEVQTPQRRRTPSSVAADVMNAKIKRLAKSPNSSQAAVDVLSQFD
jgi:hypothetical protein